MRNIPSLRRSNSWMRPTAPAAGPPYCHQAEELLGIYGLAVHEIVCLHREQFESLVGGDLESVRFDDLIHMANERKRDAKYAYLHHLETHRCSTL